MASNASVSLDSWFDVVVYTGPATWIALRAVSRRFKVIVDAFLRVARWRFVPESVRSFAPKYGDFVRFFSARGNVVRPLDVLRLLESKRGRNFIFYLVAGSLIADPLRGKKSPSASWLRDAAHVGIYVQLKKWFPRYENGQAVSTIVDNRRLQGLNPDHSLYSFYRYQASSAGASINDQIAQLDDFVLYAQQLVHNDCGALSMAVRRLSLNQTWWWKSARAAFPGFKPNNRMRELAAVAMPRLVGGLYSHSVIKSLVDYDGANGWARKLVHLDLQMSGAVHHLMARDPYNTEHRELFAMKDVADIVAGSFALSVLGRLFVSLRSLEVSGLGSRADFACTWGFVRAAPILVNVNCTFAVFGAPHSFSSGAHRASLVQLLGLEVLDIRDNTDQPKSALSFLTRLHIDNSALRSDDVQYILDSCPQLETCSVSGNQADNSRQKTVSAEVESIKPLLVSSKSLNCIKLIWAFAETVRVVVCTTLRIFVMHADSVDLAFQGTADCRHAIDLHTVKIAATRGAMAFYNVAFMRGAHRAAASRLSIRIFSGMNPWDLSFERCCSIPDRISVIIVSDEYDQHRFLQTAAIYALRVDGQDAEARLWRKLLFCSTFVHTPTGSSLVSLASALDNNEPEALGAY